jgi:serine protease inhibitor
MSRSIAVSAFVMFLEFASVIAPVRSAKTSETATTEEATPASLEERIEAALDAPIRFSFDNLTLSDVAPLIRRNYEIPVNVDYRALEQAAIELSTPIRINCNVEELSLHEAMVLALYTIDLQFVPRRGVLWITTRTSADTYLETRVFDVSDLVVDDDVESLKEIIMSTVAPTTWSDVGGPGSLKTYKVKDTTLLIFLQTWEVHRQVDALLETLRANVSAAAENPKPSPSDIKEQTGTSLPPMPDVLEKGQCAFACDLIRAHDRIETNALFAPWNIMAAVAPLAVAAHGTTQRELFDALRLPSSAQGLASTFGDVQRQLMAVDGDYKLRAASSLWLRNDLVPEPAFLESAEAFAAELRQLPGDRHIARDMINHWFADRTDGAIDQLITDPFNSDTALVAATALHFSGKWQNQFSKRATKTRAFFVGEKKISVPMMSMAERLPYAEVDGMQIIDKPMLGGDLSMMFLLPSGGSVGFQQELSALTEVERALTPASLRRWIAACKNQTVDISLPKFKIAARCDLGQILKSLGATQAFDASEADFRGVSANQKIFLSTCIHEVRLEIDEEGATASAATMGGGSFGGPPPRPSFVADHPFLFVIRDRKSGLILFAGRVVNLPGDVSERTTKDVLHVPMKAGGGSGMF